MFLVLVNPERPGQTLLKYRSLGHKESDQTSKVRYNFVTPKGITSAKISSPSPTTTSGAPMLGSVLPCSIEQCIDLTEIPERKFLSSLK